MKNKMNPWWIGLVILAFGSVISFFQINSYYADTHDMNFFFTILGIVLGLAALFCLYKTATTSTGEGG
jgi:hypothetical protein